MKTGLKNTCGNNMASNYTFSFTTAAGSSGNCDEVVTNGCFDSDISNWTTDKVTSSHTSSGYDSGAANLNGSVGSSNSTIFDSNTNINTIGTNTKISFYIKGSMTGKTLVVRLGSASYYSFGSVTTSAKTLTASGSANYTGSINTGGNWVKITLTGINSVSGLTTNDFEVRGGKTGVLSNIQIDHIRFEP